MASIIAHRRAAASAGKARLQLAETSLVLAGLLIFAGTFRVFLFSGADDREAGSLLFQLSLLSVYGSAAFLLMRGVPGWLPKLLVTAWPLLFMTGFALLSVLWSDVPPTTARRGIALLLTTFFALFVVSRFQLSEFLWILSTAFVVFAAAAVLSAAVPGLGITSHGLHEGAWRGFTGQKNEFGRTCGLGLVFSIAIAFFAEPRERAKFWLAALAALALLVLSTSKTPISATIVGLGGPFASIWLLHGRLYRIYVAAEIRTFFLIVVLPLVVLALIWLVPIVVEAMGRDLTFSGRTALWKWAIAIGSDTPWFGRGYRGFWNDGNTRYFFESFAWGRSLDGELSDSFSGPTHAHSGYVDLWLELGWIGVAVFGVLVLSTLGKIARCLQHGRRDAAICLSAVFWFMLAYAFTAKSLLQQSEDLWFLFLVFYLYAARVTAERRPPQRWDRERADSGLSRTVAADRPSGGG